MQSGVSFAVWVLVGVLLWRRQTAKPQSSSGAGLALGPLLLLAGVALLGAGFYLVEALGGIGPNGLSPAGWAAITVFGAVFVVCQTRAAAAMASLAQPSVTSPRPAASSNQDIEAQP